jgi:hypothetical protein
MLYPFPSLKIKWTDMSGLVIDGTHVSVPTLLGETYIQNTSISKHVSTNATVYAFIRKLKGKLLKLDKINEAKPKIKEIEASSDPTFMMQQLTQLCAKFFSPEETNKLLQEVNATNNCTFNLVSMDNETAWFVLEAAAACDLQRNRPVYFQAIHRTTDYVRLPRDAATITVDDLASEHTRGRTKILDDIGGLIYDLFLNFVATGGLPCTTTFSHTY